MIEQGDDGESELARAFEMYRTLREYEQHFNNAQVEVKKLASAWALAVFTAAGFIIRGDLSGGKELLDAGILLVLIAFAGNVGILGMWILDQPVYQTLLNAPFEVGLTLEQRHPQIAPIRSIMWKNSRDRGLGRFHTLFYTLPMAANAAIGGYGLARVESHNGWLLAVEGLTAVLLILMVTLSINAAIETRRKEDSDQIRWVANRWLDDRRPRTPEGEGAS